MQKLKIIIVDNAQLYRDGMEGLLRSDQRIDIVGNVDGGKKLIDLLKYITPDLILLDIEMPEMNGEKVLSYVAGNYPQIKVIMVSIHFSETLISYYKKKGASGFLPKEAEASVFFETIFEVAKGTNVYNKTIATDLILKRRKYSQVFENPINLTDREFDIVNLVCSCKQNKEIADVLCVSERTVEFHKTNIYKKTGCTNTSDLILYAIRNGLLII